MGVKALMADRLGILASRRVTPRKLRRPAAVKHYLTSLGLQKRPQIEHEGCPASRAGHIGRFRIFRLSMPVLVTAPLAPGR